MHENDAIGKRGESIFISKIMDFCGNSSPYFNPMFLGEKAGSFDFLVEALGIPSMTPLCFVQVKATRLGYTGRDRSRRLRVKIPAAAIHGMLTYPLPTYLVGVDEPNELPYLVGVTENLSSGFSSLSIQNPLDSSTLRRLWDEVGVHWQGRNCRLVHSQFSN